MRLNKKKLAALAMSAVMAASTMPFPVLAEEFTDGTETTVVEQAEVTEYEGAQKPVATDITWTITKNEDGTYKGTAAWGEKSDWPIDSKNISKVTDATCTSPETVSVVAKINGFDITESSVPVDNVPALGHTYDSGKTDTVPVKDGENRNICTENGKAIVYKVCDRCGERGASHEEEIPALGHDLTGEEIITYYNGRNVVVDKDNNIILKDGEPEAKDPTKPASYWKKVEQYCKREEKLVVLSDEQVSVPAAQTAYYVVEDGSWEGILDPVTQIKGRRYAADLSDLDVNEIALEDCSKAGKFVLKAYAKNSNTWLYDKIINVPAHHMEKTDIVVTSEDDLAMLNVTKKDGNYVVKNTSCFKDITYYEVKYCTALNEKEKCSAANTHPKEGEYSCITGEQVPLTNKVVSKTAAVAKPEGNHSVDGNLKNAINKLVKDGNGVVSYEDVKNAIKEYKDDNIGKFNAGDYVRLSENTATCIANGTATVTFLCHTCKKDIETINLTTKKLEHDYKKIVDESTVVKATCEKRGHYDVAWLCTHCGKEDPERTSERRTISTNRLPHTNETGVQNNGQPTGYKSFTASNVESYITFTGDKVIDNNGELLDMVGKNYVTSYGYWKHQVASMSAKVYTDCAICHNNSHEYGNPPIKVVEIQKEKATGEAGYIKLKASYKEENNTKTVTAEVTVPYYSSRLAYQGRVEPEVINGLHTDKDNFTRYYEDGKVVETTGIIKYAGREYLVKDGVLCDSTHGVTLVGDTFYFLANGCVQRGYTGVAIYDNESFYLSNGVVDTNVNGLVPYNGGTFLFAAGQLKKDYNGLWQNFDGSWYFLALGQVQTQYTGVAEYDGAYFYVKNGKLDTTKNGTITVDGVKYTAVDGQLYK